MEDVELVSADKIVEFVRDFVPDKGSPGEDGIQLRSSIVGGYRLGKADVHAEVLDWVMHYLEQRNCPQKLVHVLANEVAESINLELMPQFVNGDDEPESEFLLDSVLLYGSVLDKINKLCELYRNSPEELNSKTSLVESPTYQTSVCAIKNTRRKMEDRHVIIHDLNSSCGLQNMEPHKYYAIFDGHAGVEAASYSAAHLHWNIVRHPEFSTNIEQAIADAFNKTDKDFLARSQRDNIKCGCTALCCLFRGRTLYVAWLGDSQAVLVRRGLPISLVEPHKPDRESEKARIEKMGGYVAMVGTWRVNGTLAVSRAIGDPDHKPSVTSDPDIQKIELDGNEDYLVLACDGLWDRLTPNDVATMVHYNLFADVGSAESCANHLVQMSKDQGSGDNISTIVVFLKDPTRIECGIVPESPNNSAAENNSSLHHNGNTNESLLEMASSFMQNNPFSQNWNENTTASLESGKSIYVYNSGLTVGDPIGSNGPEEIYRPFSGVTLEKTSISELPTPPIEDVFASELAQHSMNSSNPFELIDANQNQDTQAREFASAILNSALESAFSSQVNEISSSEEVQSMFVGGGNTLTSVPETEDVVPESKPWMLQVQHSVHQNEVDYLPNPDLEAPPQPPPELQDVPLADLTDVQMYDSGCDTSNNPFFSTEENVDLLSNLSEEAPSTIRALHGIQEMIGISETVPGGKAQEPSTTTGFFSDNPFSTQKEDMCSAFEAMMLNQNIPKEDEDFQEVCRANKAPEEENAVSPIPPQPILNEDLFVDPLVQKLNFDVQIVEEMLIPPIESTTEDLVIPDLSTPAVTTEDVVIPAVESKRVEQVIGELSVSNVVSETVNQVIDEISSPPVVSKTEDGITTIKIEGLESQPIEDLLCTNTNFNEFESLLTNDVKTPSLTHHQVEGLFKTPEPDSTTGAFDESGHFTDIVGIEPVNVSAFPNMDCNLSSIEHPTSLLTDFGLAVTETASPKMISTPKKEFVSEVAILSPMLSMEPTIPDEISQAPEVQLENIPDGVPEADGVTEDVDSDSEKDGGWSYMRGSQKTLSKTEAAGAQAESKTPQKTKEQETKTPVVVEPVIKEAKKIVSTDKKVPAKDAKPLPKSSKTTTSVATKVSASAPKAIAPKTLKVEDKIKPKTTTSTLKSSPIRKPTTTDSLKSTTTTGTLRPSPAKPSKNTPITTTTTTVERPPKIERPKPGTVSTGAPMASSSRLAAAAAATKPKEPVKTSTTSTIRKATSATTTASKSMMSGTPKVAVNGGPRPVSAPKTQTTSTLIRKPDTSKAPAASSSSKTLTRNTMVRTGVTTSTATSTIRKTLPATLPSRPAKPPSTTTTTTTAMSKVAQAKITKETTNKTISKNPTTTTKSATATRTASKPAGVGLRPATATLGKNPSKSATPVKTEIKPIRKPVPKENGIAPKDVSEAVKTIPIAEDKAEVTEITQITTTEKFSIEEHTKELQAVDSGLASPESPESPQNGLDNQCRNEPATQPVDQ